MRKVPMLFLAMLASSVLFGQRTEFGLSLNSGLFSFAGPSAAGNSFMVIGGNSMLASPELPNYTNNPYGSRAAWCDGISADLRRVSRRRVLFGVSLGYEALRSQVSINSVNVISGFTVSDDPAQGRTNLTAQFVNLFPSIGYRIIQGTTDLDLAGGLDVAYCLSAAEHGTASANNGTTYTDSRDRKTISADVRPRLQLSARFQKLGVYVGYSYGVVNYMQGYVGGHTGAYARMLRFGLQYWVK